MVNIQIDNTLRSHRTIYLVDLIDVHTHWLRQFLWSEEFDLAIGSNDRFQKLAKAIDDEMGRIRAAVEAERFNGECAAEWRADRDGRHSSRRGAA